VLLGVRPNEVKNLLCAHIRRGVALAQIKRVGDSIHKDLAILQPHLGFPALHHLLQVNLQIAILKEDVDGWCLLLDFRVHRSSLSFDQRNIQNQQEMSWLTAEKVFRRLTRAENHLLVRGVLPNEVIDFFPADIRRRVALVQISSGIASTKTSPFSSRSRTSLLFTTCSK
jgi:hypothetical protein